MPGSFTVRSREVYRYDDGTRAVTDLTRAAGDGELLGLVGPSGRGKTTALRMVAGLEDVSEGAAVLVQGMLAGR